MYILIKDHNRNAKQVKCVNPLLLKYPKVRNQPRLILDSLQYIVVMPSLAIELNPPSAYGELVEDHFSAEALILEIPAQYWQ